LRRVGVRTNDVWAGGSCSSGPMTLTAAPTAKAPSGTFLDLVLELPVAGCGVAAARAAWFLVRNLAFAHEAKAHFVANPRALPAVVAALDAADAEVATYASSTLYAALSTHAANSGFVGFACTRRRCCLSGQDTWVCDRPLAGAACRFTCGALQIRRAVVCSRNWRVSDRAGAVCATSLT
jgi:hypothetical protein